MSLLDKIKDKVNSSTSGSAGTGTGTTPSSEPLSSKDIPKYRFQMGVNLGAWFVQERWICEKPFQKAVAPGQSDLDIAKGEDGKRILEEHWDSWIGEEDWKWIQGRGFNAVRLPIGYYHLAAVCPDALKGTDFEKYKDVYSGAWSRIEKAIEMAGKYNLGVLIDFHAAAGGQNADSHSGTSSGQANFFNSRSNLSATSSALQFLASHICRIPHIIGLEILNEPANNSKLQGWYDTTIRDLRPILGADFPIYISDAWDTSHYSQYVGNRNDFVVLDHHVYRCMTSSDRAMSGDVHARNIRQGWKSELEGYKSKSKGNIVIGEWSACLNDQGMGNVPDGEKDGQRREFTNAQLDVFGNNTGGWWFWTYKLGGGWNAGWSSRDATQAEILRKRLKRSYKGSPSQELKDGSLRQAHESHESYWSSHGGSPNPAVFAPGYSQGWDDALMFAAAPFGPNTIGFIQEWAKRRKREYENRESSLGKAAWEWEHGFEQGVKDFEKACFA